VEEFKLGDEQFNYYFPRPAPPPGAGKYSSSGYDWFRWDRGIYISVLAYFYCSCVPLCKIIPFFFWFWLVRRKWL